MAPQKYSSYKENDHTKTYKKIKLKFFQKKTFQKGAQKW